MLRGLMRWLDRADAGTWQAIAAVALCLLFPALAALALWPAGRAALALRLLKGFCVLWLVVAVLYTLAAAVQRRLRVDLHAHPDAFVISNVLVSGSLMAGWSAFAALAARDAAAGAGLPLAAGLYFAGFLSCVVACQVVGSFYTGHVYKLACLALGCAAFPAFAAWPAPARAVFGRFFDFL